MPHCLRTFSLRAGSALLGAALLVLSWAGAPNADTDTLVVTPPTPPPPPIIESIPPGGFHTGRDGTWWPVPMFVSGASLRGAESPLSLEPPVLLTDVGERHSHTIIFDSVRQRFLLFGGTKLPNEVYFNDVWERPLGGTVEWTPVAVSGALPPGRWGHTAVYDPIGDRMLVYGGRNTVYLSDVWQLSLAGTPTWSEIVPFFTPPAVRAGHTSVFDPARNRVIVFGGRNTGAFLNDTWFLNLGGTGPAWAQASISGMSLPSTRYQHVAVLDASRDRLVIHAGIGTQYYSDVWTLSLGSTLSWTRRSTSNLMGERDAACAVLDATGDRFLVFGGRQPASIHDQNLWAFNLGTFAWTLLSPSGSPPGIRRHSAMAIDPVSRRAILQGGLVGALYTLDDTWALTLDGAPAWTRLVPVPPPVITSFAPASGEAGTLVTIAGNHFSGATAVTYNSAGSNFTVVSGTEIQATVPSVATTGRIRVTTPAGTATSAADFIVPPPPPPPPGIVTRPGANRLGAAGIYDPVRGRHLLVGGGTYPQGSSDLILLNDFHSLRIGVDSTWIRIDYEGQPFTPRYAHSAVYDPVRDRILIFGGYDGSFRNDLYELRLSPSVQLLPLSVGGGPSPRDFHAAIYDPLRDRMLIYGGNFGGAALSDAWQLSLGGTPAWTRLEPGGPPAPSRMLAGSIYDPYGDRMLVFGGWAPGTRNDLWALSLAEPPAWSQLSVPGVLPGERHSHSFGLDPNRQRAVLFGGRNEEVPQVYGQTWELALTGPLQWNALATMGGSPQARYGQLALVDPVRDRMILSGGFYQSTVTDLWRLQWASDDPTPTALSLTASAVHPDRVELHGAAPSSDGALCQLERSDDGIAWRMHDSAMIDGTGSVAFTDREVLPGARYAYRLATQVAGEDSRSEEIWVQLPGGGDFALHGFSPNPAGARARVAFRLADSRPATLEVLDVSGRRVSHQRIASPATGTTTLEIAAEGGLKPGLYFVRLTQGERTAVCRGIVAP